MKAIILISGSAPSIQCGFRKDRQHTAARIHPRADPQQYDDQPATSVPRALEGFRPQTQDAPYELAQTAVPHPDGLSGNRFQTSNHLGLPDEPAWSAQECRGRLDRKRAHHPPAQPAWRVEHGPNAIPSFHNAPISAPRHPHRAAALAIARKSSAFRLAPPISAPPTSGMRMSASAFEGFTEPP